MVLDPHNRSGRSQAVFCCVLAVGMDAANPVELSPHLTFSAIAWFPLAPARSILDQRTAMEPRIFFAIDTPVAMLLNATET